jgi:HEAT repeat protein
MRSFLLAACIVVPFALSACVSETIGPSGEVVAEAEVGGKTPLEAAEERVDALLDALAQSSGKDLLGVLDRLTAYKEIALGPIRRRMETADPRTRSHLVYLLGRIGGNEAHRMMAARLADKDAVVRFESAAALLERGDLAGVPVLMKSLRDPDRKMRFKAFEALRSFTKQDFGYDFAADEARRETAAAAWDAWWAKTRAELLYVGDTVDVK